MYQATDLKPGRKLIYQNEPYEVMTYAQKVMWRWSSIINVKMRNLLSGSTINETFGDSDKFEEADISMNSYEYLYNDWAEYYFMNQNTFEQVSLSKKTIWNNILYLIEWDKVMLQEFNWNPINLSLEANVILEVIDTPPWERWDTATGGKKPATLSTWLVVQVPLFINIWDKLKVDTRTGEYMSRAN